jgi:hypothetical protein
MRSPTSAAGAFLVVITGLTAVAARGQAGGESHEWVPDRALVEQLGAAEDVAGYTIRPPKGFQIQTPNTAPNLKWFAWAGEPREDGTRPAVTLQIITPPPGESFDMPLERLADRLLAAVKRRRTNWQQGPAEKGAVNGMPFVRIRWSGTNPEVNRNTEGFVYVAVDGKDVVQLSGQDVVPGGSQALRLDEASALTFKKK